jgi:hypothetical protein
MRLQHRLGFPGAGWVEADFLDARAESVNEYGIWDTFWAY